MAGEAPNLRSAAGLFISSFSCPMTSNHFIFSIQCAVGEVIDIKEATYGENVCDSSDRVDRLNEVRDM